MTNAIDKDDPNLQPRKCGHIHYLKRAVLEGLGADLSALEAEERASDTGKAVFDLRTVWPLEKEFTDKVYDDAETVIQAHVANHDQGIEPLDNHIKFLALMRIAEALKDNPKLYNIARLLTVDAFIQHQTQKVHKDAIRALLSGIMGGEEALPGEDEPSVSVKH